MDAPTLPPAPNGVYGNVLAVVDIQSSPPSPTADTVAMGQSHESLGLATAEFSTTEIASSQLETISFPSAAVPAVAGFLSLEGLSTSSGWLSASKIFRSFDFVSQAFRTAQVGNLLGLSQTSATVPVQWAQSSGWQSWAAVADIQVDLVSVSPETAQAENELWAEPWVMQCSPQAPRELTDASRYRLSLKDKTLGYVADEDKAFLLAQQLRKLIRQASFEAESITPKPNPRATDSASIGDELSSNEFMVSAGSQPLFAIDEAMADDVGYSKEWAAVAWANNLRLALEAEPLTVGEAQMSLKNLQSADIELEGEASWYGPYFHGRATANGEIYDQNALTIAHKSLPFGTHLKIRNLMNDKTVVVRVNDRGPYVGDRSIDLSRAAADCLGSDQVGVVPYEAVLLKSAAR